MCSINDVRLYNYNFDFFRVPPIRERLVGKKLSSNFAQIFSKVHPAIKAVSGVVCLPACVTNF